MRTVMETRIMPHDMGWLHTVLSESGLLDAITEKRKGRDLKLHRATLEVGEDGWPELNLFGELGDGPRGDFVVAHKVSLDLVVIARQPEAAGVAEA